MVRIQQNSTPVVQFHQVKMQFQNYTQGLAKFTRLPADKNDFNY
jgi:hypothetical protein